MKGFLVVGGAFNPVHSQHHALLTLAREALQRDHGWEIFGAALAAAPDGYVKKKLGAEAIKGVHRLAMIARATADKPWIEPCQKTYGSALECGRAHCKGVPGAKVIILIGADRAVTSRGPKWRKALPDTVTVCVGRGESNLELRQQFEQDLANDLVPDPSSFLCLELETKAASSTRIRQVLRSLHEITDFDQKKEHLRPLIVSGILDLVVAEYILAHESGLHCD